MTQESSCSANTAEPVVEVVLVDPGFPITYRGRNSMQKREAVINRVWEVRVEGSVVGRVEYRMVTRETRTRGKRYVNSRWEVPGWVAYPNTGGRYGIERSSRKQAVEEILATQNLHS